MNLVSARILPVAIFSGSGGDATAAADAHCAPSGQAQNGLHLVARSFLLAHVGVVSLFGQNVFSLW